MELVAQADPGANNLDLSASGARIIEGGSWKKQRIVVLVPVTIELTTGSRRMISCSSGLRAPALHAVFAEKMPSAGRPVP